jgi:hypothetical protein
MWPLDRITVEVTDVDRDVVLVAITTPLGRIDLIGRVSIRDGVLLVEDAHVQGLSPGTLGRSGLNAIARKLVVEADVQGLVIEGSTRTTGRAAGRRPRPIWFPRSVSPEDVG